MPVERFTISWHKNSGAWLGTYAVSIPDYDGGEVVRAEDHDAEVARLSALGDALVDAIHGLDSYAEASFPAPMERTDRANRAVAAWRAR